MVRQLLSPDVLCHPDLGLRTQAQLCSAWCFGPCRKLWSRIKDKVELGAPPGMKLPHRFLLSFGIPPAPFHYFLSFLTQTPLAVPTASSPWREKKLFRQQPYLPGCPINPLSTQLTE